MNEHEAQTFLDSETRFEGRILVTGMVRLDGYFKGDGKANGTLVIGETGVVEADLEVDRLIVHGSFTGQVRARERVEVGASGRFEGQVHTPCLCVQEGAQLNGAVQMGDAAGAEQDEEAGKSPAASSESAERTAPERGDPQASVSSTDRMAASAKT